MIILCEYCNIHSSCYDDWMDHLLGRRHQASVSQNINKWSKKLNDRSLVGTVSGLNKPKREDVCWHFARYGLICDVYFSPESDFYVIQLDKPEYANEALDCELKNAGIFLFKLRKDITALEWVELMRRYKKEDIPEKPLKRVLSFEERHLKLVQSLKNIPLQPQLEQFKEEVSMKPEEIKARMDLISETTNILRKKFPACELHPYGSFVTGVGSNSSVLHIFFDATGASSHSFELLEDMISTTENIMELFVECIENKNSVDFFCSDLTFDNGCKPFVQFVHKDSGVVCKFTFDNSLSVEASKMIRFIILLDPRFLDLFQLVRYWGQFHKLSGPERISNYSMILLLIVFLASKKMIPSVWDLQLRCSYSKKINGWNAAYCTDASKLSTLPNNNLFQNYQVDPVTATPSASSIFNLAKDFFEKFARMDFETNLVCPQLGNVCSKSLFLSGNEYQLPICFHMFKQWTQLKTNGSRPNQLNINTPLCIQDVFNLGENVSEKTSDTTLKNFQSLCAETVDCIQKVLTCSNPKIMNIFEVDISIESCVVVPPKVYVANTTTKPDPNVSTVTSTTENTMTPTVMPSSANPFLIPTVNYDPTPPQWISQARAPITNCDAINTAIINSPLLTKSMSVHDILKFDGRRREIPRSSIPSLFYTNELNFCTRETNWHIGPCEEFVRLFRRNIQGLTTEANIIKSMNALWCSFLSDFFNTVWTTSFEFYPVPVEPNTIKEKPKARFFQSMDKFFGEWVCVSALEITSAFPPDKNPYVNQFCKINRNCEMNDMTFICYYDQRPVLSKDQLAFVVKIIFQKNNQNDWTAYAAVRHVPLKIPNTKKARERQKRKYAKLQSSLPRVLKFLVRKYQMFRLHNWFKMETTTNG